MDNIYWLYRLDPRGLTYMKVQGELNCIILSCPYLLFARCDISLVVPHDEVKVNETSFGSIFICG